MSITRRILFISEDKIKENSLIQLNVDGKVLSQSIYDTQFSHLREITGDTLYSQLLDAVAATKADPPVPLTGDIRTLLLDYIQPFLSRAVLLKLLINLHYRVTDKGVLKYNDSQATSISPQELEYARNQLENEANAFKRILIKYLKEKFNDAGCESRDEDTTSRAIGWFLGGKTANTSGGALPAPLPPPPVVTDGNGIYIGSGNSVNLGLNDDDEDNIKGRLTRDTRLLRGDPMTDQQYTEIGIVDGSIINQVVQQDATTETPVILSGNSLTVEGNRVRLNSYENDEAGGMVAESTLRISPDDASIISTNSTTGDEANFYVSTTSVRGAIFTTAKEMSYSCTPGGSVNLQVLYKAGNEVQQLNIGDANKITIRDDLNSRGIEYATDYSANYNARTLVDKGFIDSVVSPLQASILSLQSQIGVMSADIADLYFQLESYPLFITAATYEDMLAHIEGVLSDTAFILVLNDEVNGAPGNETTLYSYTETDNTLMWVGAVKMVI